MSARALLLEAPWPWWLGALALGGIAVGHLVLTRRLLGVSGVYLQLVKAVTGRRASAAESALLADEALLMAALEAATLAEMAERGDLPAAGLEGAEAPEEPGPIPAGVEAAPGPVPWTAHLLFMLALGAGGLLSAALGGRLGLSLETPAALAAVWGGGWPSLAVLGAGGLLVGFGTCLAGGCTSGHGLSGCPRLQPGSLLATASFFGTGIAVSLVLARWLG